MQTTTFLGSCVHGSGKEGATKLAGEVGRKLCSSRKYKTGGFSSCFKVRKDALHDGRGQVLRPAPFAPLLNAALPARHAQRKSAQALGICWGQAAHQLAGLVDRVS